MRSVWEEGPDSSLDVACHIHREGGVGVAGGDQSRAVWRNPQIKGSDASWRTGCKIDGRFFQPVYFFLLVRYEGGNGGFRESAENFTETWRERNDR